MYIATYVVIFTMTAVIKSFFSEDANDSAVSKQNSCVVKLCTWLIMTDHFQALAMYLCVYTIIAIYCADQASVYSASIVSYLLAIFTM